MSLTSFIASPAVRQGFRSAIAKPTFRCGRDILAPPQTNRYGLVGTAFDYLLRFHLERLNPGTKKHKWVARLGVELLRKGTSIRALAERFLTQAEQDYDRYIKCGFVTDELLSSALRLATLDVIFRAGEGVIREEHLLKVDELDVVDLRNLLAVVPEDEFKAQAFCALNPTFGYASLLVGGADADIVIDDGLIEIKTTKNLTLERKYIDQLIGYYVLAKLGGIAGSAADDARVDGWEIRWFGIYFARHGYLHRLRVDELIRAEELPGFAKWFVEAACPSEDARLSFCKQFKAPFCRDWILELQKASRLRDVSKARRSRPEAMKAGASGTPNSTRRSLT